MMYIPSRMICLLRRWLSAVLPVLALALVLPGQAAAGERVMIILDGSGSMWGQIDGTAKISIARDVLTSVLGSADSTLELGLMSYGHRQKGQCSDIETIVEPGPGNGAAIGAAADKISPLGKTPLGDAVRMAAEQLKYTEDKATVILITDGVETCRADPCALGAELEQLGVDFTAHVVGFGLSAEEGKQVSCLAEATGGLYVQADDANALAEALTDRVEELGMAEPEPQPVEAPAPIELPEVTLTGPETVEIGKKFTVHWTGPLPNNRDAIELFDPNAGPDGRRLAGRRVANGDVAEMTVELVAPVRPDVYGVQYVFGPTGDVLAEFEIQVLEAEVSLDAPASVEIGRPFTVIWKGPGANLDAIEVIDPNGAPGDGARLKSKRLVNDDYDNRSVTLAAPAEPGFYRLQYWNGDNREVLATREIEVLDAEVSLEGPTSAPIGSTIVIAWTGPGARRDAVQIFDPAAGPSGKVVYSKRLVNDDYDGRTIKLEVPADPGEYELRYYSGENRAVMATAPLTVEDAEVGLEAPDSAPIGAEIAVIWTGPGANRDSVDLLDSAGKTVVGARLADGDYKARSIRLVLPGIAGDYTLRYWNGGSRKSLAERAIIVEEVETSLDAPSSVPANQLFDVSWIGPGSRRDQIEVFDPAQGDRGRVVTSQRVVNGDMAAKTVRIKAPKEPGAYKLRYFNAASSIVLYETDITVE